jgi:hypothetical protein
MKSDLPILHVAQMGPGDIFSQLPKSSKTLQLSNIEEMITAMEQKFVSPQNLHIITLIPMW